jgi:hypothetical protein
VKHAEIKDDELKRQEEMSGELQKMKSTAQQGTWHAFVKAI